jgi:hypothetical protein
VFTDGQVDAIIRFKARIKQGRLLKKVRLEMSVYVERKAIFEKVKGLLFLYASCN